MERRRLPSLAIVTEPPLPPRQPDRRRGGLRIGRLRVNLPLLLILVLILGSVGYILWVVGAVHDGQIPLLSYGFAALGLTLAALAIGCLVGMWRAASRAQGGRSFWLALVGGLAALAAIGSFSVMTVLLLVVEP
jgi:hypothetical protein